MAQDTCLQESRPLARARRKELSLRDLAAKAQRQQQRNKFLKPFGGESIKTIHHKKNSLICLKRFAAAAETQLRVDAHVTNPFRLFAGYFLQLFCVSDFIGISVVISCY